MYQHGEDASNFYYSQRANPTTGKAMGTMIDMGVGRPDIGTIVKWKQSFLYHFVSILTLSVATNMWETKTSLNPNISKKTEMDHLLTQILVS